MFWFIVVAYARLAVAQGRELVDLAVGEKRDCVDGLCDSSLRLQMQPSSYLMRQELLPPGGKALATSVVMANSGVAEAMGVEEDTDHLDERITANDVIGAWEFRVLLLLSAVAVAWKQPYKRQNKCLVGNTAIPPSSCQNERIRRLDTAARTNASQPKCASKFRQQRTAVPSIALQEHAKAGNLSLATEILFQREADGTAVISDYNSIIALCAKCSDPKNANMWLQRVREVGLFANCVSYNAVIHAFAKNGDLKQSAAVVAQMIESGLQPDTITYNTLIDACARACDADGAEEWMQQMLDLGVNPSVVSFGSVMFACARVGSSERVEKWLHEADAHGIALNVICFSAVINAFAKAGHWTTAFAWLNRMLERDLAPTTHCFRGVMDLAIKTENLKAATDIVQQMQAMNVDLDASMSNLMVNGSRRISDVSRARAWRTLACESTRPPRHGANGTAEVGAPVLVNQHEVQKYIGRRCSGVIKEYISQKYGYICCRETFAVFGRDVFLSSSDNPNGLAKGQNVSFTLHLDKKRGLPRASDVVACQPLSRLREGPAQDGSPQERLP
mmetsp:Transcript_77319/g.214942  ORF Transcript_77319/g.214942 Transcript_77319/m.214942 type:complete len:561 (-) Transcript_77319:48-1730(-)